MKLPEHPRIRPLIVKAVLASQRLGTGSVSPEAMVPVAVFATLDQSVQACLSLMEASGLDRIAVRDDGRLLGVLSLAELQKALIRHYESIFTAIELDQKILFLQGTYSC